MSQYKTCTKCGQTKSLDEFARDKYKKSGVTSSCSICRSQFAKMRRETDPEYRQKVNQVSRAYYHANKDQMSAKYKAWVKANPDKRNEIDARFRQNNRESQRLRMMEYRKQNPEVRANWSKNNPDKQAAIYAKRSFRRRGGRVFQVTLKELRRMYASPCFYCGAPSEHIDHIIPLARGGEHRIGNLTGACASCNLSKGAKFITEWRKGN